ncbi:ribonuclease H-like domain-containing protein [Chaetomium fimeti]|uniref:Ribonuclease H-like domain-containing protein n=1 Tax=Chaetomium fimeti TaxID=1854472 RepID=A0AAE0HHI6_9PEZI|nr:ribonuclease H-like domain-containing protein [Chaetomium fimeti]
MVDPKQTAIPNHLIIGETHSFKSGMATTATPSSSPTLISSLPDIQAFLSSIPPSSTFYLDLEGKSLSRNGTLSLLTVLVHPARTTWIIDVQTLGNSAFSTPGASGKTLKAILEDPDTPKRLWDVRNDADALWAHHQVRLAGVTDVQLLENASRVADKTCLHGLGRCIENDLRLKFTELHRWLKTKKEVQALMANDIFSRRPLDAKTMQYCVNDVMYLPALRNLYAKRITSEWMGKAMEESARRVVEACGPAYMPQSDKKKLGPWGSGLGRNVLETEDQLEDELMEARAQDMLPVDDEFDNAMMEARARDMFPVDDEFDNAMMEARARDRLGYDDFDNDDYDFDDDGPVNSRDV